MFYPIISYHRDDIGTIKVFVSEYSKEPRYNAVEICSLMGVQNVKAFLFSITYTNGGLNTHSNIDGSFEALATKSALKDIFNELKADGYAPLTLDIITDAFDNEVFPYAEKEIKKLLKKRV